MTRELTQLSTECPELSAERWDCTGEVYHADTSVSQSGIKLFLKDPGQYLGQYVDQTEPSSSATPSQQFGLDVERHLFFGELPKRENVIEIPDDVLQSVTFKTGAKAGTTELQKRGEMWHAWQAAQDPDAKLLRSHEMQPIRDVYQAKVDLMMRVADSVKSHDRARKLVFGQGIPHIAFRWTDEATGLPCKCQIDMLHCTPSDNVEPKMIVDVKTAKDATPKGFMKAVSNFGYHLQAWWYREAVRLWCGIELPFVFVVIKNEPSYHVECYILPDEWMDLAERKIRYGLKAIADCQSRSNWTSPTHGRIVMLDTPPPWEE